MATLLHPLAALVFCNFRFASFFERAHSGFPDLRAGFNHLMRQVATEYFLRHSASITRRRAQFLGLIHHCFSIASRFALNSVPGFHSGNLSAFATW